MHQPESKLLSTATPLPDTSIRPNKPGAPHPSVPAYGDTGLWVNNRWRFRHLT